MKLFPSSFSEIRFALFEVRVDREIYNRLFPHLLMEADNGYPFHSDAEMATHCEDAAITALPFVQEIERDIQRMPDGYGNCFRYILHREMRKGQMTPKHMRMYRMLARRNVQPETCDRRCVARAA